MTNLIDRIPTITIQRLTAALVILIVGFWLLSGLFLFAFTTLYLVFIVVTILVVRSVPVQPGQWLARRAVRRARRGRAPRIPNESAEPVADLPAPVATRSQHAAEGQARSSEAPGAERP